WRAMKPTPIDQPIPATPAPPDDEYESASDGCAAPRAGGSAMGIENVAIPVESCAEKLSPIPCTFPAPCGTLIAWLETPVWFSPTGALSGWASPAATGSASPSRTVRGSLTDGAGAGV